VRNSIVRDLERCALLPRKIILRGPYHEPEATFRRSSTYFAAVLPLE
jgi:hypothetical protein